MESEKNPYKILDYDSALEVVQNMETKDSRNRGIVRLFTSLAAWGDKYVTSRVLPNLEMLVKELSMDKAKVEGFLTDLAFRSLVPIIRKVTVLDYDPISSPKSEFLHEILNRNTVFLRPPSMDGDSCIRIVNFCNEGSLNNIERALGGNRNRFSGAKFKEFIFTKVASNRLSETYANWDISQLYNCKYDTTKAMKEGTFFIHLKPLLKMLTDDKVLLFFRNEKATKLPNKTIFLYNDPEEIIERKNIYFEYLIEKIIPNFVRLGLMSQPKEEELANPKQLAESALKFMDANFGDEKYLAEEIVILENHLDTYKKEMFQKELSEKVQEILKYLESSGKLSKVRNLRLNEEPLPPEVVNSLLSNPSVFHVEHEDSNSVNIYVLHKSSVKEAIYLAKRLYEETGNDLEVRVLSRMHIIDSLDELQKKTFMEVETLSLFKYLSIFVRIWRTLFGKNKISEVEAELLRSKLDQSQKRNIELLKAKEIEEETKRRVQEKMKASKPETPSKKSPSKTKEAQPKKSQELLQVLEKISFILDSAWDSRTYPDREYLSESFGDSYTEEELLDLMKKNFSKEILSFQIKSATQPPKFKWPILVTRDYLKKNGKHILEKTKKEYDKEKTAVVPNQEKFDLYSSLEEFLERTLKKI